MSNIIGIRNNNTIVPYSAGSNMPAGTIISYSGSIAAFTSTASADSTTLVHKDGWAVCNGASIARASYTDLYARIAATWNVATNPLTGSAQAAPADTATNFRIPNLQGTFLRGVGDFSDNTKDTALGVWQDDATAKNGLALTDNGHNHDVRAYSSYGTDSNTGNAVRFGTNLDAAFNSNIVEDTVTTGITLAGDSETRPQNVGVYYLIKLYDNLAQVDVYIPPASATSAGLLSRYAEGSFSATFDTGMYTTGSTVLIRYVRIGNMVTLAFPDARVTANATAASWGTNAVVLPALITPSVNRTSPIMVQYANKSEAGFLDIQSGGKLYLYRSAQVDFSSGTANCGFYLATCSYLLNN